MATILILISLAIFIAYNVFMCVKNGVPTSLSATYYELPTKWRWLFTVFMWGIAMLLMPAWIEVANSFTDWRSNLTCLAFLTCALICFVGAAPNFRAFKLESDVHTISATASAVTAIVWCLVCGWNIMYVPIGSALVVFAIGLQSWTLSDCKVYWLEMMAFAATYSTVFISSLL